MVGQQAIVNCPLHAKPLPALQAKMLRPKNAAQFVSVEFFWLLLQELVMVELGRTATCLPGIFLLIMV